MSSTPRSTYEGTEGDDFESKIVMGDGETLDTRLEKVDLDQVETVTTDELCG